MIDHWMIARWCFAFEAHIWPNEQMLSHNVMKIILLNI